MALADKLDNAQPRVSSNYTLLVTKILSDLKPKDRAALNRALEDFDEETGRYRISHRALRDLLAEEGIELSDSAIQKYRSRLVRVKTKEA